MRASRGLKWENKLYKLKRSITDFSSLVNFLLVCVITPRYVIVIVCHVTFYTVNLFKEIVIYCSLALQLQQVHVQ